MTEANSLINNAVQYSGVGGSIAAAIGYRMLSTIVGSTASTDSTTDPASNNTSTAAPKTSTKDWFWRGGSTSASKKRANEYSIDKESSLPLYTLNDISYHDMPHDCWIVVYDRVYDITSFLNSHPGGDEVMLEYAGHDATLAFRGVGHSKQAEEMLKPYLVGILVESERIWTRFFNMKSDVP